MQTINNTARGCARVSVQKTIGPVRWLSCPRYKTVAMAKTTFKDRGSGSDGDEGDEGGGMRPEDWEKMHQAAIHRATIRHLNTLYKSTFEMTPQYLNKLVCDKWGNTARVRFGEKASVKGLEVHHFTEGTDVPMREYAMRLGEICKYINKKDLGFCVKSMIQSTQAIRNCDVSIWIPLDIC